MWANPYIVFSQAVILQVVWCEMDFMELHFIRFRIENWKSLLCTMRVKNVFWNYFLHQNKSLNLPNTAAKQAEMETECRNVVYFYFPYSSRIPPTPPLELFIILTTVCSIQHQEMITLFLSLCSADLLSKQNIKQKTISAISGIIGRQILVASEGQFLSPPSSHKLLFAVEECSTFFLFAVFSSWVLWSKPLRWFVS